MQTGTIKVWHHDRGWGFVTGDNGEDCFIHLRGWRDTPDYGEIKAGQRIRYEARPSRNPEHKHAIAFNAEYIDAPAHADDEPRDGLHRTLFRA